MLKNGKNTKLRNFFEFFALFCALAVIGFQIFFIYFSNTNTDWAAEASDFLTGSEDGKESKPIYIRDENVTAKIADQTEITLYSDSNTIDGELPDFAKVQDRALIFKPEVKDFGNYNFSIVSEDEEARFVYNFKVKVSLPDVDFAKLKTDVEAILGDQKPKYAVYVYDLKRGKSFGINEEEIFYPGSTSKLPYAIITLRDVDKGIYTLDSVSPTLTRLIIHGSNTAMMELEAMLGGNAVYDQRVRDELGVDNIFRFPHVVQASDLGRLYIGIYHQEYLSKSSNDFLLYLLLNTGPGYDNRIKQGLPIERGVRFAHKTGWVTTTGGGEAYNDSGIVYGETTDYVIVVLDKNIIKNDAIAMMKPISEKVYEALN